MSKATKILIPVLVLVVVSVAAIIYTILQKPLLTPVGGLLGTWQSSVAGKGVEVRTETKVGPVTMKLYEAGDIELIFDSVKDNTATGQIRMTNFCVTGESETAGITTPIPKVCVEDSGYVPAMAKVSGSELDFGTVTVGSVTTTMQGSYIGDIMTGTMTIIDPAFGVLKGEFNLSRKR